VGALEAASRISERTAAMEGLRLNPDIWISVTWLCKNVSIRDQFAWKAEREEIPLCPS
jgi:hypothetical protein